MEAAGTLQEETETMRVGMSEMGTSAKKINMTGEELSEISALMERSIGEIGKQVDQFKV